SHSPGCGRASRCSRRRSPLPGDRPEAIHHPGGDMTRSLPIGRRGSRTARSPRWQALVRRGRRLALALPVLLAGALGFGSGAAAQSFPERPVTLIVPFSTGGDADLSGRNLAAALQKVIGQSVVVMNRAGASGAIGSMAVKEAKPDGYTLLVARIGS